MRTICIVTATRAEYGLLRPVVQKVAASDELDLQLVVTGAHLCPRLGETVHEIENDGFPIAARLPIFTDDADEPVACTIARTINVFDSYFAAHRPDAVLLLGDRFEIFAVAAAAAARHIPIAHISGGDVTLGAASKIVSDTITLLLLEDSSAAYAAYNSGEAQLVKDVPTDEIPSLTRAEDGGDFYLDEIMGTYYISLNDQKEPFTDPNVRKAMSLAIDRDYVANTIMQGIYTPATALVGPGIVDNEGYFMDNANGGKPYIGDDYEANLEEAKQLMAEAGYPDGEGFPVVEYSANDAGYHIPVAEYVQQAWGELGITVNINKVEWASFLPMRRAGDYDISRNGWSMDYNDPSNMLELFTTNNGNNDGKYANPDFDKVIEESRVADKATHFEKLHEAEDMLMADAACIPVAYYHDFWLQSPSLKGTWHSPYGYWYLQYGYVEE